MCPSVSFLEEMLISWEGSDQIRQKHISFLLTSQSASVHVTLGGGVCWGDDGACQLSYLYLTLEPLLRGTVINILRNTDLPWKGSCITELIHFLYFLAEVIEVCNQVSRATLQWNQVQDA